MPSNRNTIDDLRAGLDSLDARLIDLLGKRFAICERVARFKRANGIPMMQPGRIETVRRQATNRGASRGLTVEFVSQLYKLIIEEACRRETQIMDNNGNGEMLVHDRDSMCISCAADGIIHNRRTNPSAAAELSPAVTIGAQGAVGQLIMHKLYDNGIVVTGIDKEEAKQTDLPCPQIRADVLTAHREAIEAIRRAKLVLVCLPESAALAALPIITRSMTAGALWVDTLSVKSRICVELATSMKHLQALSLNLMFGPGIDFDGQNVIVVEVQPGEKSARFLELLRQWHSTVVSLSAADHDMLASAVQAATHAAVLAFGVTLNELQIDMSRAWKSSTPPFRVLTALLSRIVLSNPEVYWDIQTGNPFAEHARNRLIASLSEINSTITKRDSGRFRNMFRTLGEGLAANCPELASVRSGLFPRADL